MAQAAVTSPTHPSWIRGSQPERGRSITRKEGDEAAISPAGGKELSAGHIPPQLPRFIPANLLTEQLRWAHHPSSLHPMVCWGWWDHGAMKAPSQKLGWEAGLPLWRGAGGTEHPCLARPGRGEPWQQHSVMSPWQCGW